MAEVQRDVLRGERVTDLQVSRVGHCFSTGLIAPSTRNDHMERWRNLRQRDCIARRADDRLSRRSQASSSVIASNRQSKLNLNEPRQEINADMTLCPEFSKEVILFGANQFVLNPNTSFG
jgi:hypothetical protein